MLHKEYLKKEIEMVHAKSFSLRFVFINQTINWYSNFLFKKLY